MNFPYLITTVSTGYLIYFPDEETDMEKVKLTFSPTINTDHTDSGNLPLSAGILAH